MTNYSYLRINANTDIPCEFVDPDKDLKDMIRTGSKYSLWCTDGKRYNVKIFYDDSGQDDLGNPLLPNHRVNAMIDAGRFTSKKFDYIGKTRNQDLKEHWGSSYFMGDVVLVVIDGKPIPDCCIYGENPLEFLLDIKEPNRRMINKYGEEKSRMMIHPGMGMVMPSGTITAEYFENPIWEVKDYHIVPIGCENTEYIELLKSWGWEYEQ